MEVGSVFLRWYEESYIDWMTYYTEIEYKFYRERSRWILISLTVPTCLIYLSSFWRNWGLKRLRTPTVIDTVTYFPDPTSRSVVSPRAEDALTRYFFAIGDFRDWLSYREPFLRKGDQCQCMNIKPWLFWPNSRQRRREIITPLELPVIVLTSNPKFSLCFLLSSLTSTGADPLGTP